METEALLNTPNARESLDKTALTETIPSAGL